jgi:hypothetical protein
LLTSPTSCVSGGTEAVTVPNIRDGIDATLLLV